MGKVKVKWFGPSVKKRVESQIDRNLDIAAIVLNSGIRQDLSVTGLHGASLLSVERAGTSSKVLAQFPSKPGQPPHKVTGELQRCVGWDRGKGAHSMFGKRNIRRIGLGMGGKDSVQKGIWLEFGTRWMLPRPFIRPGFFKRVARVKQILATRVK